MIFAHGSMAMGELYAGLLQPVIHPGSLLPTLALALWAAQQGAPLLWQVPVAFAGAAAAAGCAALAGVAVPSAAAIQTAAMLGFGALVAARVRLPAAGALVLAVVAGLAQGSIGVFGEPAAATRPVLYALGFLLGLGLLLFHVENLAVRAHAFWMQVGIRVVGSWIAAVGMLIGVLGLRS
jgi:urease accessory protein